jgi:dTDP-4-dehydrorhamnose reductase
MKNILILGSHGMLGSQLKKVFAEAIGWDHEDCDVTNFEELKTKISGLTQTPEIIINCIAFNDVDGAEEKEALALKLNCELAGNLALYCSQIGSILVHFSSNYVFDGKKGEYDENDLPHPLSIYGNSKYLGEKAIREYTKQYYIIRTSVLFGPTGESKHSKKSFVNLMLDLSGKTDTIMAVEDEVNSLTYVEDLVGAIVAIVKEKPEFGIYHITNTGSASWYEFAKEIFKITQKKVTLKPIPAGTFSRSALRPAKAVLVNTKLPPLRSWQEALKEFLISPKL